MVEPNGMSLEHLLMPYIDYLTFGIHIAVGIIIGISVIIALVGIFRILLLNHRNEKNEILAVKKEKKINMVRFDMQYYLKMSGCAWRGDC